MLQVLSPADRSVLDQALTAAASDIEGVGYWVTQPDPADPESGDWEAAEVTGPLPVPGGGILIIHAGNTPPEMKIGDIPRLLTRRLAEAGITDATVSPGPTLGDRYKILNSFAPVARALMRGPDDRRDAQRRPWLVTGLIEIAVEWLRREMRPEMELNALVVSAEIPVTLDTLPTVVGDVLGHGDGTQGVTVVATDFRTQVAAAVFGEFSGLGLKLSSAGRSWTSADVVQHMRIARDVIQGHAENLHSAAVTARPADPCLLGSQWFAWDTVSFLPAWYQILSLANDQMAGVGAYPGGLRPGFTVVADANRIDLTVGEPEQWIPGHPDGEAVRAQARKELTAGADY